MTAQAAAAPSFAADAMLGSLARWLRLLGYDCLYERGVDDDALVERAGAEGRVVLTRDRKVARNAKTAVFVASHDLEEQLLEVVRALGLPLPEEPPTSRCSMCNALLMPAAKPEAAAAGVPPGALTLHGEFWRCPSCNRFYWKGTHFTSMASRLRDLRGRLDVATK